tara:strand:- start:1106 stop:2533 length:1428 start_codon:yes stop_codon:yes gene_type:complete
MRFNYDYKSIALNFLNKILEKVSLNLVKTEKSELEIKKLKKLKDTQEFKTQVNSLINKYPENPNLNLIYSEFLFRNMDLEWMSQSKIYLKKRNQLIDKMNLKNFDLEFLGSENICGSLGNHWEIKNIIDANFFGVRKEKKILIFLHKGSKLRNKTLIKYFSKYLEIVEENNLSSDLIKLEKFFKIPSGFLVPLNDQVIFHEFLPSYINSFHSFSKRKNCFSMTEEDKKIGGELLEKLGIPKGKWFVTIHVREPGYRGENKNNTTEKFRNSSPQNYIKAINYIVSKGGWVVRVGDKSMTKLPKMKNFIDYAHSNFKSEFLDVFLAANSRFCIGTPSGFYAMADYFGVPVLLTNAAMSSQFLSLKKEDLYLPRLIKHKNEFLNFESMFSHPNVWLYSDKLFSQQGLTTIENNENEILEATEEMLNRVSYKEKENNNTNQLKAKDIITKKINEISDVKLLPAASIASSYIEKNKGYLF